jgi:hypothetical protein
METLHSTNLGSMKFTLSAHASHNITSLFHDQHSKNTNHVFTPALLHGSPTATTPTTANLRL